MRKYIDASLYSIFVGLGSVELRICIDDFLMFKNYI